MGLKNKLRKAKERREIRKKSKKDLEKLMNNFFRIFGWETTRGFKNLYFYNHDEELEKKLKEKHPLFLNYIKEKNCVVAYNPDRPSRESNETTKKVVRKYIEKLIIEKHKGKKDLKDTEILGLAVLFDDIDYSWACGLMNYPSSIEYIEEEKLRKILPRIVNSLVYSFGINPYKTEEKIKKFCGEYRHINESWRYSAALTKKLKLDELPSTDLIAIQ